MVSSSTRGCQGVQNQLGNELAVTQQELHDVSQDGFQFFKGRKMNVGMGPDAGEQRFVPAFQKLGQKSFPVAEVIDKAPCIGAGPQGQAANGKGAQPGFPDNHGTRIERALWWISVWA